MTLPKDGFVREAQLVSNSDNVGPLPFSSSTLWRMVAEGKFPRPVKLSARITAWRCEDVHKWIQAQGKAA
ncbi:helix-turn-helix transcriptional regulator [Aeromonas enteropelogenes]|uniref:helix-turn-helix transcriptional regulator n=1 Tax=Aeromonas TaxID=642 RepID=UPI0031373C72